MNQEQNRDILPFNPAKSVDLGELGLTSPLNSRRRPQLSVTDLRVLVLPAPGTHNKIQPWEGMRDIFAPETCARHILVCTPEQFSKVPENVLAVASQRKGNYAGAEAYQFLVEFACGLHSHNVGEYQVVSQLKEELQRYNNTTQNDIGPNDLSNQLRPTSVSRLISCVLEDQKAIREELVNYLPKDLSNRQKFSMVLAKQAAQITGGEDILIIANSSAGSGDFENLAHVLGRDNTHTVSRIRVTHPNPHVLRDRMTDLQILRRDKKISCEIESVPFEHVAPIVQLVDHVFCLLPMAPSGTPLTLESHHIDNLLRISWRLRERQDGFFVHVKGDPTNQGGSTAEWQIDEPWFIGPESLKLRYAEARNLQIGILSRARAAAQNCALSRALGERPPFATKLKDQPFTSVVCGLTHSAYAQLYGQVAERRGLMDNSTSPDRYLKHPCTNDTTQLSDLSYPTFTLRREASAPYLPGGAEEAHLPGNFTKSILQNLPGIARDILTRRERVTPNGVERLSPESLEHNVEILPFNVLVKNLPESFSGFTILHATDLHLAAEDRTPLLRLRGVFDALCRQERRPDCMIITGDFVHRSFTECSNEFLDHLSEWTGAGVAILYVLGNHDNRDGQRVRLKALLDSVGAIDITNSDWSIHRGVDEIRVLGLDDLTTGLPSTPALSDGSVTPRIMALHNPEGFPDSILPHVSLILAGHIHQGEIRFAFSRDGAHYFDGISIMKRDPSSGYTDRLSIQDWASVDGTPLYVSAGLARRWEHKGFPYSLRKRNPRCSVAIHRLLPDE